MILEGCLPLSLSVLPGFSFPVNLNAVGKHIKLSTRSLPVQFAFASSLMLAHSVGGINYISKRYLSVKVLGSRATRRWALAQGTDDTSDGSWTDRSYHGKQTKGTWTRRGNVVKDHLGIQKFVPLFVTYSEEWQDL